MSATEPPEMPTPLTDQAGVPEPPAPLPIEASDRWIGVLWSPSTYLRGHLFIHGLAFLLVAWSLAWQADRYHAGTLRGLLFLVSRITPAEWAVAFAVAGVLKLVAGFSYPRLARVAILVGIALITVWAVGFVIAWAWDNATIFGPVTFGLLLAEHVVAVTFLDGRLRWHEGRARHIKAAAR